MSHGGIMAGSIYAGSPGGGGRRRDRQPQPLGSPTAPAEALARGATPRAILAPTAVMNGERASPRSSPRDRGGASLRALGRPPRLRRRAGSTAPTARGRTTPARRPRRPCAPSSSPAPPQGRRGSRRASRLANKRRRTWRARASTPGRRNRGGPRKSSSGRRPWPRRRRGECCRRSAAASTRRGLR